MKFLVDYIDTHFCTPIFDHPKQTRSNDTRPDSCEVEILLKDEGETEPIQLFLHRLRPDQDLFVWSVHDKGDRNEIRYIQENGWVIPHREIAQAIRMESRLKQSPELYPWLIGHESLEAMRGDLVSLIAFSKFREHNTKNANAGLHSRVVRSMYRNLGTNPDIFNKLKPFLEQQLLDPVWSFEEKQSMKWVLSVGHLIEKIRNIFPEEQNVPGLDQALVDLLVYWLSPEMNMDSLPDEKSIQKAAGNFFHYHHLSEVHDRHISDLFQKFAVLAREAHEAGWLRDQPVVMARTNQLRRILQRAHREKWSWLLSLKHPESALKEGLVYRYAHGPQEQKIMGLFADHVSINVAAPNQDPDLYFAIKPFSQRIQGLIQKETTTPQDKKVMLKFISEIILQKLLAQGQNMEIFWQGSFKERINFYPNFSTSLSRPAWSELIDWTREQLRQFDPELPRPHVLLNKTALGIDGAVTLAGALVAALAMDHREARITGTTAMGTGLGGLSGSLICYWADLSNRYGQCDLLGGVAGGLIGGLLSGLLLPKKHEPDPMIIMPPPPIGMDKRWPDDGYGP